MFSVERVKLGVVRVAMFGAVPPTPVAAFRREEGLFCRGQSLDAGRTRAALFLFCLGFSVRLASDPQKCPRGDVFTAADPYVEVGVNPRRGKDAVVLRNLTGGGDRFADRHCREIGIALDPSVKLA